MLSHLRRRRVLLVPMALALLASGCAGAPASTDAPEADEPAVRGITVARTPFLSDSTVAIAEQAGWFDELGIEVTVVEVRSTGESMPLLLSGEIDVAYAGFSGAMARAITEGSDVRAVASITTNDPAACDDYGFVALPDARTRFDLTDPDDLRRVRIGGPFDVGVTVLWMAEELAARAGLTVDELDLRSVSTADAAPTLTGGGVDLVAAAEPAVTRLRETAGAEVVASISELLPPLASSGLFFGPRLLADEELAATYLAIHLRALERYSEGPTVENIDAVAASTGLERDLLASMCWRPMTGAIDPYVDGVSELLAYAQSQGQLDGVPGPEDLWDRGTRERALGILAEWRAPQGG